MIYVNKLLCLCIYTCLYLMFILEHTNEKTTSLHIKPLKAYNWKTVT